MRHVIANILLASVVCISFQANAQTLTTPADARKVADGFMSRIGSGNFEEAFKQVKPHMALPAAEFDAKAAEATSQFAGVPERFGAYKGFELVRQETAGQSLMRFTYVAKYEKAPMRWRFIFYKSDKGWVITDFHVDANRNALFSGEG